MWIRLRRWLNDVRVQDPIRHRQAIVLQFFLFSMLGASLCTLLSSFIDPNPPLTRAFFVLVLASFSCGIALAITLLRYGYLRWTIVLITLLFLVAIATIMVAVGIRSAAATVAGFAIPVTLVGLIVGRRALVLTIAASIIIFTVIALLEEYAPQVVRFVSLEDHPFGRSVMFAMALIIQGLFLDLFGQVLRDALAVTQARERDLDRLRDDLERTVVERTAALQAALQDLQVHSEAQAQLLAQVEEQRSLIRDLSVPVLPISKTILVMPLIGALDSERLMIFQEQALQAIKRSSARTLVVDITGVSLVDSQVAQELLAIVRVSRLLGTEAVLVGIRPEIAQAIVGMNLGFAKMRTFNDLQAALEQLLIR